METPSLPPPSDAAQSQQRVKGDRNQAIGQVLGGIVVYGQVIYANVAEPIPEESQTSTLGPNPYKGLLAFQKTEGDRFFCRDRYCHLDR